MVSLFYLQQHSLLSQIFLKTNNLKANEERKKEYRIEVEVEFTVTLVEKSTKLMAMTAAELGLPGFRFHPTEEELLDFYLKNVVLGKNLREDVIGHLNLYRYDPCDLPGKSKIGEREWYFYVPRERKHGSGGRPNRTTENGFWKATGSDRRIVSQSEPKRIIGLRKTLVFYEGRAPKGTKTDWVMNEYRLPDSFPKPKDTVLCKIYRKATSLKVLEQRAAKEEESRPLPSQASSSVSSFDSFPFQEDPVTSSISPHHQIGMTLKKEAVQDMAMTIQDDNINETMKGKGRGSSLQLPMGKLPELHLPKSTVDWNPDNFLLSSPWLQYFSPCYADILNF